MVTIKLSYKKYEILSALALHQIKELIWEGVFSKTEVDKDGCIRYFILIMDNEYNRIKKNLPSIKIEEVKEMKDEQGS